MSRSEKQNSTVRRKPWAADHPNYHLPNVSIALVPHPRLEARLDRHPPNQTLQTLETPHFHFRESTRRTRHHPISPHAKNQLWFWHGLNWSPPKFATTHCTQLTAPTLQREQHHTVATRTIFLSASSASPKCPSALIGLWARVL